MPRSPQLCVVLLFLIASAVTALSSLPSRPSYSFSRGRLAGGKAAGYSDVIGGANANVNDDANANDSTAAASALPDAPGGVGCSEDRDQLYGAYNALHSLAQDFKKPFDSPAVLVVGHQTSGKSALMEALMGFQFNQVPLHRIK
jgi:hypothetical protein